MFEMSPVLCQDTPNKKMLAPWTKFSTQEALTFYRDASPEDAIHSNRCRAGKLDNVSQKCNTFKLFPVQRNLYR